MDLNDTDIKTMFGQLSARLDRIEKQLELSGGELKKTNKELSARLDRIEKRLQPTGYDTKNMLRAWAARPGRSGLAPEPPGKERKENGHTAPFSTIQPYRSMFNETSNDKDRKISGLQNEIDKLRQEKDEKKPPALTLDELMGKMNDSVVSANKASVEKMAESGSPAYIVDDVQIELKGNIDVRDRSTIRFALRPKPTIKIIDEKMPNE
jgi:tetrahydromethanopterin S-methyltransferase subunit G